jgi:hypothetical protein
MKLPSSLLLAPLALLLAGSTAAAQASGSAYSTDSKGVVANIFAKPKDVYLAGGPGPNAGCGNNGLANGPYYFQVTDPSGITLLSSDPLAKRVVTVSGGVITAAPGGHVVANGPCGSKVVQLWPFNTSSSSGSEYKAWLMPVADYVAGGPNFGFPSSRSKTDNFKVKGGKPVESALIRGTVFYDYNQNGVYDPAVANELPIPGWRVELDGNAVTFTDQDGHYEFIRDANTAHVLNSYAPAPGYVGVPGGLWAPTTPIQVAFVAVPPTTTVDFGLLWLINTPEFATSKGFWHNAGEPLLAACEPQWRIVLNGLSLRQNITVPYPPPNPDPTLWKVTEIGSFAQAFDELGDFLVGDAAKGILAYILSTQYAAANLNKSCGPLAGETTYIDRLGDSVLISFEKMASDTLGLLADPKSCDTGPTGDQAWREHMMGCMNEWSGMNSSGENIFTRDSAFPSFLSPY